MKRQPTTRVGLCWQASRRSRRRGCAKNPATLLGLLVAHSLTARAVGRELSELYAQIQRVALELAQQGDEAAHATPHLEAIEDQLKTQALKSRLAAREKSLEVRELRLVEASAAQRSEPPTGIPHS